MKNNFNIIPYYCHAVLLALLITGTACHSSSKGSVDKPSMASSDASFTPPDFNYIFESGKDGYACYRIPAIVMTTKGTLLAFAEGRKDGCSDTGDIDLVLKRSEDGGTTWTDPIVVWDDGQNTCGNPAPVVDEETGEIFLLSTWNMGTDHEQDIISGESEDTRRVFFLSSGDDGKSWSKPVETTESVKKANWTWYATGPVSGIQLKNKEYKGRLVIPCDFIEAGAQKAGSHIIYSDDHGKTWQLGGIAPHDQVNESTVTELSSGDLMLNMRNYDPKEDYRKVAVSRDGGISWSEVFSDTALVEPICQGSLISHRFSRDKHHYLAFSNPASKDKRMNMTVRISADDGKTWPISKTIHEGPSAYSNLVSLPNGDIGIFYEGGNERPYEGLAFKIIPATEWI